MINALFIEYNIQAVIKGENGKWAATTKVAALSEDDFVFHTPEDAIKNPIV